MTEEPLPMAGDPDQQTPAPKPTLLDDPMGQIKEEVTATLAQMGNNAEAAKDQIARFLTSIEPDITAAISAGDSLSLRILKDRAAMELGRASLGLLNRERIAVQNTVVTVVRILIKIGIGAIAA